MAGGSFSKKTSSHRAWLGSEIYEGHIEALRHHRVLPPASQVLVRIPGTETAPTPAAGEIVVFDEHFYRGFGLPASSFFSDLFFFKQQFIAMDKAELEKLVGPRPMTPCGAALVHHRSKSGFPQLPLQESIKQWQKGFFYVKNADPARDALNMPPININPLTKLN
ncbi:hypothetical protein ZWY2020_043147 [Hordeum vulgare]|nr:hypothetical protein ZWY2020_043147 [Hordeum vulgare]